MNTVNPVNDQEGAGQEGSSKNNTKRSKSNSSKGSGQAKIVKTYLEEKDHLKIR